MNIPQKDGIDADPIVQLADMPVSSNVSPVMPASLASGFDKSKLLLPLAVLIGAILISSSILYVHFDNTNSDGGSQAAAAPKKITKVDIDLDGAMILGDSKAPVTIVEYADFQCPYCARYFQQSQKAIISQYVNTGKAKFVWKDYAFLGQESIWAASAARCANDQGKFWEYHDYLYQHQGAENSGVFSKANLKKFASALGLNSSQFNSCLDTDKYAAAVQKETQAGSSIGVSGTPATFINGLMVVDGNGNSVGAAPFATFQTVIDKLIKK